MTTAELVTYALLTGNDLDITHGSCSCGAEQVGSDAHYNDCAIGLPATITTTGETQ